MYLEFEFTDKGIHILIALGPPQPIGISTEVS
jgi:hypothetical protein